MTRPLVFATRNEHKVTEVAEILAPVLSQLGVHLVAADAIDGAPEVVESGVTFRANAELKALALARASGVPALSDDSGLAVDVLGGAPGIFSARWSGNEAGADRSRAQVDQANLELLLAQLADVPDEHRGAAFVCSAVVATPRGEVRATEGRLAGRLLRAPRGANGFGYDPIFVPDGLDLTTAELSADEKNAISHRRLAFDALAPELANLLA